ncbi:MAG: hypothetical protein GXP45_02195 [bacterium]|nr:hypothetical protein [bacterium]
MSKRAIIIFVVAISFFVNGTLFAGGFDWTATGQNDQEIHHEEINPIVTRNLDRVINNIKSMIDVKYAIDQQIVIYQKIENRLGELLEIVGTQKLMVVDYLWRSIDTILQSLVREKTDAKADLNSFSFQ